MTMLAQRAGFTFLFGLSTAICFHALGSALSLGLHDDQHTYTLLVLPTVAALILSKWNSLRSAVVPSLPEGTLLLAVGIGIAVVGSRRTPDVRLAFEILALVVLWIGTFVFCFGIETARSLMFPLALLLGFVPVPSFALARIVQWLQEASSFAAWLLFSTVGVPASRDGVFISIPGLNIEVAEECSSIRSSSILLVTTIVLAYVLLQTPWRRVLAVLIAIPLSVAKNGLRIFIIGLLGTKVDPGFLTGWLHRAGGIVFFSIALFLELLLIQLWRFHELRVATAPEVEVGSLSSPITLYK
jgi:exosortase